MGIYLGLPGHLGTFTKHMWFSMGRVALLASTLGSLARGNWLLQCSSCVDQAMFGDETIKTEITDADLAVLLAQLKQIRVRQYTHINDEFYNKFFPKKQLGIIAQEIQSSIPGMVAHVPERRWTTMKGASNVTKNVMLIRESHLLMLTVGSLQLLARRAEHWDREVERVSKEMSQVVDEQNLNRRKREEMIESIIRVTATAEILQQGLSKTEERYMVIASAQDLLDKREAEGKRLLEAQMTDLANQTNAQGSAVEQLRIDVREALEKEANADLVEKRKRAEAEMETQLVKRSIEKLRWEEEQKTIKMRNEEQRNSEAQATQLHMERTAHEQLKRKEADLELMSSQEESNMRQHHIKQKGEKELLELKISSEKFQAEMKLKEAIEAAKIAEEAKIRAQRENEDVNLRAQQAELEAAKKKVIEAIQATAEIVQKWISALYSEPENLVKGIGSIVALFGGIYVCREMATLLREQLNKRLGRPSLVRSTSRKGVIQIVWTGFLRLLKLKAKHGAEFNDVVLHPHLEQQIMRLANATQQAKRRKMPLQHVMFYGPPGTGKTMVAQRFAEYSGLEYAIMSGGDVAPLEEQAVTELHKLFKWVHRSRRGVLLFIDEADAFLSKRSSNGQMSEALRNALTTMLYHTGTPTSQFMMVVATNRPMDLDSAVLDRLDESVEFGLPDTKERERMIELYFKKYITEPLGIVPVDSAKDAVNGSAPSNGVPKDSKGAKATGEEPTPIKDCVDLASLYQAAKEMHGFSGREIAKFFTALQTHFLHIDARRSKKGTVTGMPKRQFMQVVEGKVSEHNRTGEFISDAYEYKFRSREGTPLPSPSHGASPASRPGGPRPQC